MGFVAASALTWSTALGVGDPDNNWFFLVTGVTATDDTVSISNPFGEFDFAGDIP